MKYFPHTKDDIEQMLAVVGKKSLSELFDEIPDELKFRGTFDIPQAQSEIEVRRTITALAEKNKTLVCFAGAGAYDHYTPSMIPYLMSRSEFSTSYTPYQAEISQGTLQYIFEYQTMMARLTGMDLSNASMYDGATATAEAMMMCVAAAKKRQRVLISQTMLPAVISVAQTYAKFHGIDLVGIPATDHGTTDKAAIAQLLAAGDVAGIIVPQTNYYGIIEDLAGLADACHAAKALLVVYSIASTLAVLKTPGEWGADIACGDAQSLGIPLGFGGPYIGYLCTRMPLVRKMPGRLVGQTTDAQGRRCFVLTMQAREQHIRREKATSNICTAQGYQCLHVAIYLSLLGTRGLQQVNTMSADGAHALCEALSRLDAFAPTFPDEPFLGEFTMTYTGKLPLAELHQRLADSGFLAGVMAEGRTDRLIFAVTEQRTREEVDALVKTIKTLTES